MNEVDKKIFLNKKEIDVLNNDLKSKVLELEKVDSEIKKIEEEFNNLKEENKKNIYKKILSYVKWFIFPFIVCILLAHTFSNYFYILLFIMLILLIFKVYKNTEYERYNLSKESIDKFSNNELWYQNNKKKIEEEIGTLLIKIDELKKDNSNLKIESDKIRFNEKESMMEIEKYLNIMGEK